MFNVEKAQVLSGKLLLAVGHVLESLRSKHKLSGVKLVIHGDLLRNCWDWCV